MRRVLGLVVALALAVSVASCIFVESDHCQEGALACDGEIIEECIGDDWVVIEDCWVRCGGVCDFDPYGRPVCLC